MAKPESLSLIDKIWDFFSSVRLTVVVLLTIAATSFLGTLIPQDENFPLHFKEQYGDFLYRVFYSLNFFDIYHSLWFQLLLLILTINIIICSMERIQATSKIIFAKEQSKGVSRFKNASATETFQVDFQPDRLKDVYFQTLKAEFHRVDIEETEKGFAVFAEKGRLTRLGVYIVHLSVVFLLFGGLIGSIFGLEGFVNIPEESSVDRIRLRKTGHTYPLDFEIRCEDFDVSFYKNGAPKEYRSSLTLLKKGEIVYQKDIIVNDPLRYDGFNIFQSSYGMLPPKTVTLGFLSSDSNMEYIKKVSFGQLIELPEGGGEFVIYDYSNSYHYMNMNLRETFLGRFTKDDAEPEDILLPLRYPNFDKMRKGKFIVTVIDYDPRYYTGLQVTKDPGVPVVYLGFIVMILGLIVTFFMSHQRLCVEVIARSKGAEVRIAGLANKNQIGIEQKVEKISHKMKDVSDKTLKPH